MLFLRVIVCILLTFSFFAGKTKHRKDRSWSLSHDIDKDPAERSLEGWQNKLPLEVLKLASNSINLVDSGSRLVLARCLYDFYQPQLASSISPSSAVGNTSAPSSVLLDPVSIPISVPVSVQPPDISNFYFAAIVRGSTGFISHGYNSVTTPPLVFPPTDPLLPSTWITPYLVLHCLDFRRRIFRIGSCF